MEFTNSASLSFQRAKVVQEPTKIYHDGVLISEKDAKQADE